MVVTRKNDAAATVVTFILNPEMMNAINRAQNMPFFRYYFFGAVFFNTMFFVDSTIRIL